MLCHGQLATTRPALPHLTAFYLCLALGGVLGGLFEISGGPGALPGTASWNTRSASPRACLAQALGSPMRWSGPGMHLART